MSPPEQAHNYGQQDRRRGAAMDKPKPLSQEHREDFWRRCGWSPELPDTEREAIERAWDDESIEMAELFGW
ncbi:hypothetical protein GCM10023319_42090 [Nocardia iowensis]